MIVYTVQRYVEGAIAVLVLVFSFWPHAELGSALLGLLFIRAVILNEIFFRRKKKGESEKEENPYASINAFWNRPRPEKDNRMLKQCAAALFALGCILFFATPWFVKSDSPATCFSSIINSGNILVDYSAWFYCVFFVDAFWLVRRIIVSFMPLIAFLWIYSQFEIYRYAKSKNR